jgi:putative adenylate-forming enzyme
MNARLLAQILRRRQDLRSHDRWSRRDLEVHQAGQLRDLREFTSERSRFYQRFHHGLGTRSLHELPVLTKAMLMEQFDELSTDPAVRRDDVLQYISTMKTGQRFLDRYYAASTSGSTGRRGLFVWSQTEWATIMASYSRGQDWAGVPTRITGRQSLALVSSRTPWHQSALVGATAESRFIPTLRLDATEPLPALNDQLNHFQPDVLVAYASMGRVLADEQLAGRLHIAPRAVMTASEVLSDESRRRIERAFGSSPFNQYAATETAGIAADCELHRMHFYEDLVIAEIVDEMNRPVPAGAFGAKVLVTVLFSRTLPLIRYEMSDCLRASSETCPCGRSLAVLDAVEGRREDVLELPSRDGGKVTVHPNVFHEILDLLPLRGWQVREEPFGLRVLVVGPPDVVQSKAWSQQLAAAVANQGARVGQVLVERVEDIPRTALGKAPLIQRMTGPTAETEPMPNGETH